MIATVAEDSDIHEALELIARTAFAGCGHERRRRLRGILSIDDIVDGLSADLSAAAAVLKGEIRRDAAGLGSVKVGG